MASPLRGAAARWRRARRERRLNRFRPSYVDLDHHGAREFAEFLDQLDAVDSIVNFDHYLRTGAGAVHDDDHDGAACFVCGGPVTDRHLRARHGRDLRSGGAPGVSAGA